MATVKQGDIAPAFSVNDQHGNQVSLSDFLGKTVTDKKLVEAYGVWVEKSMYGKVYMGTARKTFIINAEGKIAHIIEKVETSRSSQQVLDLLG